MSCAPLISNAPSFFQDFTSSVQTYVRDGEHVARTSKWMGELDFYPQAERAIISSRPKKIVDLGAGTCGLLIRCLKKLPNAKGVGIDINSSACSKARSIIKEAKLSDRLSVIEAPIQSLLENPAPLEAADIIHAGFVFHDLMPDEEETLDALLKTFCEKAPNGMLVVVDAVPYAQNAGEQAFSAAFTFLHNHFMGRQLMTEEQWKAKLSAAGYNLIQVERLGISGGRIFTAKIA
jgi:SAM-dependent methyltransferase